MIGFQRITIGSGEAVTCRRCHGERQSTSFNDTAAVLAAVDEVTSRHDGRSVNVLFRGAEPFAHPGLPELIRGAARAGVERIGLVTDGGALAVHDNASGVVHAGVRHLIVRTIGVGSEADKRAGRVRLSADTLVGVRAFAAAAEREGVSVAIAAEVPVCRHNVEELPALVAALGRAGVRCVTLMVDDGSTPIAASASGVIAAACDTGIISGIWVAVRGLPLPDEYVLHQASPGVRS